MDKRASNEGFAVLRLILSLGAVSPMLAPLAISGSPLVPWHALEIACAAIVAVPCILLHQRMRMSQSMEGPYERVLGRRTDKTHWPLMLFLAMFLLSFSFPEPDSWRGLAAIMAVMCLATLVVWRTGFHFAHPYFIFMGYRILAVEPPDDAGPHTDNVGWVLITKSPNIPGDRLMVHRMTDHVYLD